MRGEHLPQIDALRGIAALVVALIFHQHYLLGGYRTGPLDGLPLFTQLHAYGWIAVDLFFVISGFIFSYVYFASGKIETSARDFGVARLARLYPLHLVTLLAAALALALRNPSSSNLDFKHFVLNVLMLQESGLNNGFSYNFPAWSISVEMYCYALFFCMAKRFPEFLFQFAIVIALVSLCLTTGREQPTLDHVARGFCGFFAGVLAYRFRTAPLVFLVPLAVIPFFFIGHVRFFSWGSVLALTAFPAWVLIAPRLGFMGSAAFRWLGSRSYSIYLVHAPIYWFLSVAISGGRPIKEPWPWLALSTALILFVAHFSYLYLEAPARAWIRRAALMRGSSNLS